MSLTQHQKAAESKSKGKFQSLNINTLYQGASNKNTSKSLPQKHGLQSLGKVPTARRAPASLPSVKSEQGGNDPTVVLVPTGGSGWAKDGEKHPGLEEKEPSQAQPEAKKESVQVKPSSGPKSWSSVTGANPASSSSAASQQSRHFQPSHQKSPLFGQDFPTLRAGDGPPGPHSDLHATNQQPPLHHHQQQPAVPDHQHPNHHQNARSLLEHAAGKEDSGAAAYGPGPSLRPQTFGNWSQGGSKPPVGAGNSDAAGEEPPPIVPPQPHKPTPPGPGGHISQISTRSKSPPSRGGSAGGNNSANPTNQYKSIMPAFMEALELPSGPPESLGSNRRRPPPPNNHHHMTHHARREQMSRGGGGRPQTDFAAPSIIDKEKLRRMDDLADDWTYDDDDFDYNKKLQSDDEEAENDNVRPDPNWADQVERAQYVPLSNNNYYDDVKRSGMGFSMEEEDWRRTKKSEEVMKNIERARQRREEEENRFRRPEDFSARVVVEDRHSSGSRRFEDKDTKAPAGPDRRGDWSAYEDKRNSGGKPRVFEDRRDGGGRFDERYDGRRDGSGYYAPRFDRRDKEGGGGNAWRDDGRKDDARGVREDFPPRKQDDGPYDSEMGSKAGYHHPKDPAGRIFDEGKALRGGGWADEEAQHVFEDSARNEEKRRGDRHWSGRSPPYNRQDSEKSHSGSPEVGVENGSSDWSGRGKSMSDWADFEDSDRIEKLEFERDFESREGDRPSRPNSRDSRISRDSRGSKESKGPRQASGDKLAKPPPDLMAKERKPEKDAMGRCAPASVPEYDADGVKGGFRKAQPQTDFRGYFRDSPVEERKPVRPVPGPITRDKLEAADSKETACGMTQLKKRDINNKQPEVKPLEAEEPEKLHPLVDSDMLENISEDEDPLLGLDREDKNGAAYLRGGRGGRGRGVDMRGKPLPGHGRIGRGDRGGRGAVRGAKMDGRGRGGNMGGKWGDLEQDCEDDGIKKGMKIKDDRDKGNQLSGAGFMPRGLPSRRGRGEFRGRGGNMGGRNNMHQRSMMDDGMMMNEDAADYMEDDRMRMQQSLPPRMQRKKEEAGKHRHLGKLGHDGEGGDGLEDWESGSDNSGEEKRRGPSRGGGRGGKAPWVNKAPKGPMGMVGPQDGSYRELTPESAEAMKKRPGIENFDLHDYSSVVVVDQGENHMCAEAEMENNDNGEFMQVVNKKVKPGSREDRRSFERTGPKMGNDKGNFMPNDYKNRDYKDGGGYDKKMGKPAYDRRKTPLPPRLAKQREVSRAQARGCGGSPTGMEQNGWPEGDKMGVFQVEDLGTTAWEKPPPQRRDKADINEGGNDLRASPKIHKENGGGGGGIQQTMVFENTALKGGPKGSDKLSMDKTGPIQLPMGMNKEDATELKLDFSFGGEEMANQGKPPLSMTRTLPHLPTSQGLPASSSTDDLSVKLANTKKLWDAPGMPTLQENATTSAASGWTDSAGFTENSGFDGFQDAGNQNPAENVYDKNENHTAGVANNVAKAKPQQQQPLALDPDNRPNHMAYSRMTNTGMPGAVPSPPTQIGQMGPLQAQPWAFPIDRTSPMYNPYGAAAAANQLNQSILMPGTHSIGTDLFTGSNGASGYRLQGTAAGHYPGGQQSTTNNVLISQANLISGGVKHNSQIGPIGTKAGTGASTSPYLQSGLGTLPNTYIQYEPGNYNYVNANAAASLQRGNAPPTQASYYQTLANRQPQLALNAALQGSYNHHAMSQQQLRANHVAGLPFMKNDLAGMAGQQKSPLTDTFASNSYNNTRSHSQAGGPPSPKTKLKLDQQQHQQVAAAAKIAGITNLTNHLTQMRINYNLSMGVQGYNPSPIGRPQVNPPTVMGHNISNKVGDYYNTEAQFVCAEKSRGWTALAADRRHEDKFEGDVEGEKGNGDTAQEGENGNREEQNVEQDLSEQQK